MHGNAAKNTHNVVLAELTARADSGRVLDAPCGTGQLAARVRDAGFRVIGLDMDEAAAVDGIEIRSADLNQPLPLADAEVDYVLSVEGIEHLERPFSFIRECNRVLRDGGTMIITTPNISSLRSRWRWFWSGFHYKCKYALDETDPTPFHHINMLSYPEMRYLLHTNGFQIEKITTNRMKAAHRLYAPFVPFVALFSRLVIWRARPSEINRPLSRSVHKEMMTRELLFGELMILVARKRSNA